MAHVTYLLGAGASAGNNESLRLESNDSRHVEGVPIVAKFNSDLRTYVYFLRDIGTRMYDGPIYEPIRDKARDAANYFLDIIEDLKLIYSFDTYAKMLFESKNSEKLLTLKRLLKCYLIYRQYSSFRDRRYDLLFGALINDGKISPKTNFISWNYDTQVELSLSKFSERNDGTNLVFQEYMNFVFIDKLPNKEKPLLIKLNGSISVNEENKIEHVNTASHSPVTGLRASLASYEDLLKYKSPLINFSWENKEHQESNVLIAKDVFSKTNVLVVIGYSIPTLNRQIDTQLFKALKNGTIIYVQCLTNEDFINVESKIRSMLQVSYAIEIKHIPYTSEFYVPFQTAI